MAALGVGANVVCLGATNAVRETVSAWRAIFLGEGPDQAGADMSNLWKGVTNLLILAVFTVVLLLLVVTMLALRVR